MTNRKSPGGRRCFRISEEHLLLILEQVPQKIALDERFSAIILKFRLCVTGVDWYTQNPMNEIAIATDDMHYVVSELLALHVPESSEGFRVHQPNSH